MSEGLATPRAERPSMPGYPVPEDVRGVLPWSWAEQRLNVARNFWLSTVRPDGRPHAMPVWGVWIAGCFYFSTGAGSRKAKNLARNGHCVVTTESATEVVVVEGAALRLTDEALLQRFVQSYAAKYSWPLEVTPEGVADAQGAGGPVFEVRPLVVFGFSEDLHNATRWRFERAVSS